MTDKAEVVEAEREQFEKWAQTCEGNCNRHDLRQTFRGGDYTNLLVERDWQVWQASRAALKAQPAPTEAQGEDSARLDAERYQWLKERFTGYDFFFMGDPEADTEEGKGKQVIVFEIDQDFHAGRDFEAAIDRARASAETGGVKS